jgi:hypothetical protein
LLLLLGPADWVSPIDHGFSMLPPGQDSPPLRRSDMVFIALVAVLLLIAFAAHEGRKSFTSLSIVLGLIALIACIVYSVRALNIG